MALFLLVTALPWTTVWGAGFKELRQLGSVRQDWSAGRAAEHAEHLRDMNTPTVASPVTLDDIVRRVNALHLDPPVRVYLPSERQPFWRVRNETQNRPRVRELELDLRTGELLREQKFGAKPLLDRIIGIGVAAHEGQLFGAANQVLGLTTALGLITLCISAIVMWWRRRPGGRLGIPAARVEGFRISWPLGLTIVALGVLLPVFGASLVVLAVTTRVFSPAR
jgi:uncharacterized iron-regulated membrane protein